MRKWIAIFCCLALLTGSWAAAEVQQKAPDFVMEGFEGDSSGSVWENNLFFTRMQEKTGVSFSFQQYGDYNRWTERKAAIAAGENLPDVLFKAALTPEETREMYEAGVLLDLRPYLEQYAPDLWALLSGNDAWMKAISLEDGAIPALPAFNRLQNNNVMWINTTWLRRVGMEMPTTAEELTEVLRAFRDKDPNNNGNFDEKPLSFIGMWELRFLGHAFGMTDNDYYVSVKDGQVVSSLTTDTNRQFLTWLHQLWEENLLDHNGFITADSLRQITDENKPIPYGVILASTPMTVLPAKSAEQYTVLMPLIWEGQQVYRSFVGDVIRGTFAVTRACKNPEKLVAWVNTLYTEEGSIMAQYGLENEEYTWREDGKWEWTEDQETVARVILPERTIGEGAPGILSESFELKYADDAARESIAALNELAKKSVYPYPYVFLSREDHQRLGELQPELSRFAETEMARFVTGDVPLDDEHWNLFCEGVRERKLDEMIAIWQKYIR